MGIWHVGKTRRKRKADAASSSAASDAKRAKTEVPDSDDSDLEVLSSDSEEEDLANAPDMLASSRASVRRAATLILQTADGDRFAFRMRATDKFSMLFEAAAEKLECGVDDIRLMLDGESLDEDGTPEKHDIAIKDEVTIDVLFV